MIANRSIPTEPIGSIPRPRRLIDAVARTGGDIDDPSLQSLLDDAVRDTIVRFEQTGSPVITDGEQRRYRSLWDYCVHRLPNIAPDGFAIPGAGEVGRMPRLTRAPFRYRDRADQHVELARRYARAPVKQAVISPGALSLMYPRAGIPGYSREQFIQDLIAEHAAEVRSCLEKGAFAVQIDFTEARLAVEIDPSGMLLASFIELNNLALAQFSADERRRLGVHTCPGGDLDPSATADFDFAELLPSLLQLNVTNFYVSLAAERDRGRVLRTIREYLKPEQRIFVGVVSPTTPFVESVEEVRDRVLEAADYIPLGQLGTTDDCGFSPSNDAQSTTRDLAFAKIAARVRGTALAAEVLGGG